MHFTSEQNSEIMKAVTQVIVAILMALIPLIVGVLGYIVSKVNGNSRRLSHLENGGGSERMNAAIDAAIVSGKLVQGKGKNVNNNRNNDPGTVGGEDSAASSGGAP